ncbi:MAG: S41 family peptidase [Planctomycetota bacterium]
MNTVNLAFARRIVARLALVAAVLTTAVCAQRTPTNLDFEDGKLNRAAPGWFVPTRGYEALLAKRKGKKKGLCLHLSQQAGDRPAAFGNVLQSVDAKPYRGKTVRFSADVRNMGQGGRAQLWLRVDRPDSQRGFFDNMGDRPITSRKWQRYQIVGKVHDDAVGIFFGMMLLGRGGSAFLDDVKLEVVDDVAPAKIEAPRPLAGRGLENVIAFTRLLGYVRYFHPSDQAREVDWERFAITGIGAVEPMQGPKELAAKLQELFEPLAPTVRVTAGTARAPLPKVLRARPKNASVVAWEHLGVNPTDSQSIYRSKVVEGSTGTMGRLLGKRNAADLPDPKQPFRKKLGGGVRCMVPLALYKDKAGTLPHADPEATVGKQDEAQPKLTADDRATRLAAVALGWNVFQHFYPYFDVVKVDWARVLRTSLQKAATDKDAAEFLKTLRRMVARLQDGHGYVSHMSDNRTGTLPLAFTWADNMLVVDRVGASMAADIEPGDVVLKIDGKPAAKVMAQVALGVAASTAQFRRYRVLQSLGRGVAGKSVNLELQRGSKRTSAKLEYGRVFRPLPEKRPDKITELKPGIWYVDISRIKDKDFLGALDNLEQAKGIVIDFRGYPRTLNSHVFFQHIIQASVQSAQWHIPIPQRPDQEGMKCKATGRWLILPKKPYLAAKKVFLIDGRAISYAESCMGIVEHYKLGEIVGEATAGTNGNVNPIRLPGGYSVMWTGMKVLKHDGSQHHGVGIKPTVPVARTVAGIRAGKDEFLLKALQILQDGQ